MKKLHKFISLILALILLLSAFPLTASAQEVQKPLTGFDSDESYPVLVQDEPQGFSVDWDNSCSFIVKPETTAIATFSLSPTENSLDLEWLSLYVVHNEDDYIPALDNSQKEGSLSNSYLLFAGETYYCRISSEVNESGLVTLTYNDVPDIPLNEKITAESDHQGLYRFIPEKDMVVSYHSLDDSYITSAILEDTSDMGRYDMYQSSFFYGVKAGQTYYLHTNYHNNDGSFVIDELPSDDLLFGQSYQFRYNPEDPPVTPTNSWETPIRCLRYTPQEDGWVQFSASADFNNYTRLLDSRFEHLFGNMANSTYDHQVKINYYAKADETYYLMISSLDEIDPTEGTYTVSVNNVSYEPLQKGHNSFTFDRENGIQMYEYIPDSDGYLDFTIDNNYATMCIYYDEMRNMFYDQTKLFCHQGKAYYITVALYDYAEETNFSIDIADSVFSEIKLDQTDSFDFNRKTVYTFTPDKNMVADLSVSSEKSSDIYYSVFTGTGEEIIVEGLLDTVHGQQNIVFPAKADETYYIQFTSWEESYGIYNVTLSETQPKTLSVDQAESSSLASGGSIVYRFSSEEDILIKLDFSDSTDNGYIGLLDADFNILQKTDDYYSGVTCNCKAGETYYFFMTGNREYSSNIQFTPVQMSEFEYQIYYESVTITKYNGNKKEVEIPAEIDGYPVKVIDYGAFENTKIEAVTIPDTVNEINYGAFSYCNNLKRITFMTLDDEVWVNSDAFEGCTDCTVYGYEGTAAETIAVNNGFAFVPASLDDLPEFEYIVENGKANITRYNRSEKNLVIPSEIDGYLVDCVSIGKKDCLESVVIPEGVTRLGEGVFGDSANLKEISIPDSVNDIGRMAFYSTPWLADQYDSDPGDPVIYAGKVALYVKDQVNCPADVTLREGTVTISNSTFHHTKLEHLTIPDSVTRIGSGAFVGCDNLKSITIPDSVTDIGDQLFMMCSNLEEVNLPKNITEIKFASFNGCQKLKSITIPDSVTSIQGHAFVNCTSLATIHVPDSVTEIGQMVFDNTAWYNNQPDGPVYCGKVFYRYKGECPEKVALRPDTVAIASLAFTHCTPLREITIPDGVKNIGQMAFYDCDNLTEVTIPATVTSISNNMALGFSSSESARVEGFTIYGYADTEANRYAVDHDFIFISIGENPNVDEYGYEVGCYYLNATIDGVQQTVRFMPSNGYSILKNIPLNAGDTIRLTRYVGYNRFTDLLAEQEIQDTANYELYINEDGRSKTLTLSAADDDGTLSPVNSQKITTSDRFILGDADNNEQADLTDVTFIQYLVSGLDPGEITENTLICGDVDGNGITDISDATYIQRYIAGIEIPFAVGYRI